ncbi:MAG: cation diffusion facilitator family transporter [Defluviitaleaceae bacterium]|nr:cation diffusion facilitator family transporter [Defluviitaleaceae bacterium]
MLLKLLIKDYKNTESPAVRKKYGLLSGICGIILNMLLAGLKFIMGAITNSVAITADAINNLTDCLTSLLTILGFRWSTKPADREHPFGHARIEYLISLAVAAIIFITGYEVMRTSILKIINPEPLYFTPWAAVVLAFSMVVKLWMYMFNRKLGKTINSDTLLAVGIDSRNDVLINVVTLFSLFFTLFTSFVIDGYVGALLALVFLKSGYNIAKEALGRIIGNPSNGSIAVKIKEIVKSQEGVLGMHDLIVHSYGPGRDMASLHVEIPMDMTLAASHILTEKIEDALLKQLGIPVVIQLTPIDLSDQRLQNIICTTSSLIAKEYPYLHPNEFRIKDGKPRPILVFDLEFPLEIKRRNALALRDAVSKDIANVLPEYDCDINIEYGFSESPPQALS